MISKLRSILKSTNHKRLFSNFFSLSILHAVNYILPIITLPYLIRVLGTEYFGLLAFSTVTIRYFSIIVDFGFSLTAAREISIYKNNKEKVIEIFSSVMIIKTLLVLCCFALLMLLVFSFERFGKDWEIYILTFGIVIGEALFPMWFFQGMEQMKYITYLNILSKLIFTVTIFVFVREQSDFHMVPVLTSLGFFIAGIWSILVIKKRFDVHFKFQPIKIIWFHIKQGWSVFTAVAFSSLYRESNTFILGLFASNTIVGNYSIAEKIIKSIQSLQTPLGQTLFPFLSQKNSDIVLKEFILKYLKYAILIYSLTWLVIFLNSEFIIKVFTKSIDNNIIYNFNILSCIILIGGMNYYFGMLGFLSMKKDKDFSNSVTLAGMSNLILCFLLSYFFQDKGAALSVFISEVILLTSLIIYLHKYIQQSSKNNHER